jgi:tetratricopeptide (TPR) repeat protein
VSHPAVDLLTAGATLAPRAAAALAAVGDADGAIGLVDAWEALPEEERGDPGPFSPALARARIDLAEGRTEEADDRLTLAVEGNLQAIYYLPDLARARHLGGRTNGAISALEDFLEVRHPRRMHRVPGQLGPVLLHLGELHEEVGDPDSAADAYSRLVELWRDADPELQPRVEHAADRLRSLRGGGL